MLAGGLLLSSPETNVNPNTETVNAGVSILKLRGLFDRNPETTYISVFGFTIYDGKKAAVRKAARQAHRAARRAGK